MIWIVVPILVILINIPFGYWRAKVRKFSFQWFAAVHLPIPFIVFLRISSHLGWHWTTYPLLVGAYFCGQFTGGKLLKSDNGPKKQTEEK